MLRDGRHIVGMMRSFDQFANLVLEDTVERRTVASENGADSSLLYLTRVQAKYFTAICRSDFTS